MNKIKITETVLRDAHQSLIATRLSTEEMIPILEKLDSVGYHALEMWGGATFDSCLRYLDEDPWERLRTIRKHVKNTKLQMLLRGQNILGYKHYPDEVVIEFVKRAIYNGIDIVRIFDAMNDVKNIELALKVAKLEGAHAQGAIAYTTSPVHTIGKFVKMAVDLRDIGADSICIKDMSGILTPYTAEKLVKEIKKAVDLPLEIHSHCTSGLGSMTYLKAIEAGCDIIDTAISPFATGTSQPPTESMVATLKEIDKDTGLDINLLSEIADYFIPLKEEHFDMGHLSIKAMSVNIKTLISQIPGGMLSNLISQLKNQNSLDKLEEVLEEIPHVRKDMGYPPLVTPTSQIVGTQAMINVITGKRYSMIPKEVKAYVSGMYGQPTVPISDEIVEMVIGDGKRITDRPANHLEPILDKLREEIWDYIKQPEDLLSYALFPDVALEYFKKRELEEEDDTVIPV
jgi:oxaloacetate decarboxylase alpha subunit